VAPAGRLLNRENELERLDRAIQYEIPDLRSKLHSAAR